MSHSGQGVEQHPVQAIGLMLLAVFLLATMDVAIKQLVAHYPSMQVVLLRCALSLPLLSAWMLARAQRLFRTRFLKAHLARGAVGLLMLFAIGECLRELQLADAYAIFFAAPLLLTLLSGPVMREPAGAVRTGAAVLGFTGVLVVLKPGAVAWISYGSMMALLAVVCYAVIVLLVRALGRQEESLTIAFWFTALVGLGSAPFAWAVWLPLQSRHWPWFVVLGVTGTLGQVLLTAAFRRASAAVVAPYDYTHMVWAVLYGWLVWGHLPATTTWLGAGIITASGLFILYREHRLRRRQAAAAGLGH